MKEDVVLVTSWYMGNRNLSGMIGHTQSIGNLKVQHQWWHASFRNAKLTAATPCLLIVPLPMRLYSNSLIATIGFFYRMVSHEADFLPLLLLAVNSINSSFYSGLKAETMLHMQILSLWQQWKSTSGSKWMILKHRGHEVTEFEKGKWSRQRGHFPAKQQDGFKATCVNMRVLVSETFF